MKLFSRFSTRTKVALTAVIALFAIALPVAVFAGFGPDRPTKVYQGPGTPGFDYPTFNSFTNVPGIGDERAFFTGKYPNGTVLTDPLAQVKNGDELTLQVYVHNGADPKYNADGSGIAKNTKVRVALPSTIAKNQTAKAYITADNTQPKEVYDTLDFGALNGGLFQLEYVAGSAHIRGNYIDKPLSDNVVTTGALIGSDVLDGMVKGCFNQEVLVTLKVKVKMPQYTINKEVRFAGQTSNDWKKSVDAKKGDNLEWLITFKNVGTTELKDVKVVDEVPSGLNVVPGTVKLINGNYPNGYVYPDSAIQANGRQVNVGIGNYNPGILAYVMFKTTVTPTAEQCGVVNLVNKAYATPKDMGAIWETASVKVDTQKPCVEEKPVYSCDALDVVTSDGRKVDATVKYTAKNGATFKSASFNFGDGSAVVNTDKTTVSHTYAADGTYKIASSVTFKVDGKDVTVNGEQCTKSVTFTSGKPVTPPTTPPTTLPNTGIGSVAGLFAGVSAAAGAAHFAWSSRRAREQ